MNSNHPKILAGPVDNNELWPSERIKPWPENARTHTEEDVDLLVASYSDFGPTSRILVDESGTIIGGHCRFRALLKIGVTHIHVTVAKGWSEEKKRAYRILDNASAARAGWDYDLLRPELQYLKGFDFKLESLGFDSKELARLLAPTPTEGLTDPDHAPNAEERAVTRLGDTWLLGAHRVHCGDSTSAAAVVAALGGLTPVLMVSDPPYGVDYDPTWRGKNGERTVRSKGKVLNDDRADWREAWALYPGDVAYVWHGALHAAIVAESLRACGLELRSQIVWAKQLFAFSRGDYHWKHECCWYVVRKGASGHWTGDRKQTTVWEISNNNAFGNPAREEVWGHGTQKPVECMRRPIVNNSEPGAVIYDPFLGSGTTVIAAEMTGRRCVGLELSPQYVDVIVKRWQAFTGKQPTLEATGETFAERTAAVNEVMRARSGSAE